MFFRLGRSLGVVCLWGSKDPAYRCYDPALPQQPAIRFSAILGDPIVASEESRSALSNWHWVFPTLHPIFQGRTNALDITNLKREKESKEKTQEERQRKKPDHNLLAL